MFAYVATLIGKLLGKTEAVTTATESTSVVTLTPPAINWLVPEEGFEAILDALQGTTTQKWWGLASSFERSSPGNPPTQIDFARRQVTMLSQPSAESESEGEGFEIRYATYDNSLGVFVSPKGGPIGKGIFYYAIYKLRLQEARRSSDVAEMYNREIRNIMEDKVRAALTHYARVQQYLSMLRDLGYDPQGVSIGQEGSSRVVRFDVGAAVIGPEVKICQHYGDLISTGTWALHCFENVGPWLHVADFKRDYRPEISDFLATHRRRAA